MFREGDQALAIMSSSQAAQTRQSRWAVSVAHMLQAYLKVLPRHGIIAAEDTHYYRMVITLSLRPEADWWDKLQAESSLWHGAQNPLQPQISRCRAAATTPAPQLSGRPGPADAGSAKQPGQRWEPAPADAWQEVADEFLRRSAVRGPLLRSRSASPQRPRPAPEPYQRQEAAGPGKRRPTFREEVHVPVMRGVQPHDEQCQHARRSSSGGSAAGIPSQSLLEPRAAAERPVPSAAELSRERRGRVQRWLRSASEADSGSGRDRIPAAWVVPSEQHVHWPESGEAVGSWKSSGHTDGRHQTDNLNRGRGRNLEAMGRMVTNRSVSPDPVMRSRQHEREMVSAASPNRHRSLSPHATRRVPQDGSLGHCVRRHVSRDRARLASPPPATSAERHADHRNEAIDNHRGHLRSSCTGGDARRVGYSSNRHRSVSPAALGRAAPDRSLCHTNGRHGGGDRARLASLPSARPAERERQRRRDVHGMAEAATQLQASYAEWQRATRHLIAVGHRATRHRRWKTCGRAFQAWHRAVLAREERAARKMAADAHGQQRAKRARFGEWRASAKEELRKYESDAHSRCRRRTLLSWRMGVAGARQQRLRRTGALQQAAGRMRNRMEAAAFQGWRAGAQWRARMRQKADRCSRRMQNINKSRAFASWLQRAHTHQDARQVREQRIRGMQGYRLSKVLLSWGSRAARKTSRKSAAETAVRTMRSFTARRAFSAWQGKAATAMHHQALLATALQRLRNSLLHAAWSAWSHKAARRAALRQTLAVAMEAMRGRTTRSLLHAWAAWTNGRRRRRRIFAAAVGRMRSRLLAGAFTVWAEHAACSASLRTRAAGAVARWSSRHLTAALGCWQDHTRLAASHRHIIAVTVSRLRNRTLTAAFAGWRVHKRRSSSHRSTLAAAVGRLRNRTLAAAFASWAGFAPGSAVSRRKLAGALAALRSRELAAAFSAAQREVLAKAIGRLKSILLAAAFEGWMDFVARKTSRKAAMLMAHSFHREQLVGSAFADWHRNAAEDADERRVLEMCVRRLQSGCMFRAFDGWVSRVERTKAAREKMRLVRTALLEGTKVRSWNTWVCAVEEGQAERAMLQRAMAHWTTRGARVAFKHWQEQLQAARALEQRAMSIGARLMNTLLARAWASWKDEVVLSRAKRSIMLDCIQKLQTRVLGRLFRAWHASALELANLRNKARVVITRLSHRATCIAFATWVDWNYEKQHQRHLLGPVVQRLLHQHLATAFSTWHEQLVIFAALKVDGEAAARKMMAARTAYLLHHWQPLSHASRADSGLAGKVLLRRGAPIAPAGCGCVLCICNPAAFVLDRVHV
ncbi:g1371 [Coccomyxa elongata]